MKNSFFIILLFSLFITKNINSQPPVADFISNTTYACVGEAVFYIDLSLNATQWHWIFEGGEPYESFEQYPFVTYSSPGTYDVTLIVSNNSGSDTITKTNYISIFQANPYIHINVSQNPICTGSQVTFTAEIIDGGPEPGFMWFVNGVDVQVYEPTFTTSSLNNGDNVYCVLTSSENCAINNPVTSNTIVMEVNNNLPVSIIIFSDNTSACPGSAVYFYSQTQNAGTNPTYLWLKNGEEIGDNSPTLTLTDFSDGDIISCYVTSSEQCVINNPAYSNEITVGVYPTPQFLISHNDVLCYGEASGSAEIIIDDPQQYTYLWSNGDLVHYITNLSEGNYSVTVTNNFGCTAQGSVYISQPQDISVSFSVTNANPGINNGSITASINGGTPDYNILWLPVNIVNTLTISNLSAGEYTISITDANGCTHVESVWVYENNCSLNYVIDSLKNISCFGFSDGYILIHAINGQEPYNYVWSNGNIGNELSNITAGTYIVTITDNLNCELIDTINIIQPSPLQYSLNTIPSTCGNNNGSATINVSGGMPPYYYEWNTEPPQFTETASYLSAGIYFVTILDANGCNLTVQVEISDNSNLTVEITTVNNVTCSNMCNGSAIINIEGGTLPFTILWSNGQNNDTINNLCVGNYYVTVTDANNCSVVKILSIIEENILSVSSNVTNISCYQNCNGSITLSVSGGVTPYSFLWSIPGQTTPNLTNLCAGQYSFTVTDATGCSVINTLNISEPSSLNIQFNIVQPTCGQNNGIITANVSGGTAPYTYLWNTQPPQNTQTVSNLSSGTYIVTVTDANNCTKTNSILLTAIPFSVIIDSIKHVTCFGGNNGYVHLNIQGTPPYTIQWYPAGINTSSLSAGTYYYTVTDMLGCNSIGNFTITQPQPLVINVSVTNASCGLNNGSAIAYVNGGVAPYSFSWNTNPPQNTQSIQNLSAGIYIVTVTDANGCTKTATAIVQSQSNLNIILDTLVNVTCYGYSNGIISIHTTGGTPPYSYQWSNGSTSSIISGLSAGNYWVTVTDSNNCIAIQNYTINSPQEMNVNYTLNYANCTSTSNVLINITTTGGTPPYSYIWSTGSHAEDIVVNQAGTYFVTVIDSKNCPPVVKEITVQQASIINVSVVKQDALCKNECTGNINITPTGGIPPYGYYWKGPNGFISTDEDIYNLCAGWYYVTISDMRGCTIQRSFTIGEPPLLNASFSLISNPTCNGLCNGKIKILASGGTPQYTYTWDGISCPCFGNYVTNLCAGVYTITITDAKGCTKVLQTELIDPEGFPLSAISTNVTCYGYNNGSIDLSVDTILSFPVSYSWVGPNNYTSTSEDIYNLVAGYYTVVATSGNYCSSLIIHITQPPKLEVYFIVRNETFAGASDGQIIAKITGGTPPYSLNWNNGQTNDTISGLSAGTYTVTITDNNGCYVIKSVKVNIGIGISENNIENECFQIIGNKNITIYSNGCVEKIHLYDLLGKFLREIKANEKNIYISTSDLPNGLYTLKIHTSSGIFVRKVIITN
ncbi:MAG: T9SS type A sorting domain-containing protein [Bacteroidales bacterium]|nr:T9SS type A sorting domain-containing protein [Bacteroidales bacterium]